MKNLSLMRSLLVLLVNCAIAHIATAQTATEPNEGSRLTRDSILGSFHFTWWGQPGRTYFIQQSGDLSTWEYKPLIASGTAGLLTWDFPATAPSFFLRLRSTDLPTTDPFNDDFDGDKVSNWNELLQGTDPLSAADTDANGLPDDWEKFYFGHLGVAPNAEAPGGGRTNLQHFQLGTNPKSPPPNFAASIVVGTKVPDQDASQNLYPADDSGLLLKNGNFSTPAVQAGEWGLFAATPDPADPTIPIIPGWVAISGILVELQHFTGISPSGQYCELDSHWPSANHNGPSHHGIKQTATLTPGHYLLIFDYRGRDPEGASFTANRFTVNAQIGPALPVQLFNNTNSPASTTEWKRATASFDVTAADPSQPNASFPVTLLFDEVGEPHGVQGE